MKPRLFLVAICFFFLTTSISFGYTATFLPRISALEEYTDNVFLTQDNNLKEDDYITTVTPGFTGELTGKQGKASLSYDASYAFYHRNDEFNGWRHEANFSGMYLPGKNTIFNIAEQFLHTEDPIRSSDIAVLRTENPTVPIDTTERTTREVYTTNYAHADLSHEFGKDQSFRLGYTHALINNDDPAYQDEQNHMASAGLTYWFGPEWGFDVSGQYTRGIYEISDNMNEYQGSLSLLKRFGKHFTTYLRYTHDVATYDNQSGSDNTYNPAVGCKYDIEKDISLIADIGYFYTHSTASDSRNDTSSPTGELRLIKQLQHGKLNMALLGGYEYDVYGAQSSGAYAVYYEASASLSHQLAKHVYGNVYGSYRYTDYKDSSGRTDKNPTAGLQVVWQALQWMNVALNYRYTTINSTLDTVEYTENRVGVRVTLTPTQPFHTSRY
jgi:Putative beta-barrel porin 2